MWAGLYAGVISAASGNAGIVRSRGLEEGGHGSPIVTVEHVYRGNERHDEHDL